MNPNSCACYGSNDIHECYCKLKNMKQETLEEVALKLYQYQSENPPYTIITPKAKVEGFIDGAKWQQERMYSEDEVKEIIKISCDEGMLIQRTINDKFKIPYMRIKDFTVRIFTQFKKK